MTVLMTGPVHGQELRALTLEVRDQSVEVSGSSPSAAVALVGYHRYTHDGVLVNVRTQLVRESPPAAVRPSEARGPTVFDLGRPIGRYAVFVAVDLTTGRYGAFRGTARKLEEEFDRLSLALDANEKPSLLELPDPHGFIWLVRPNC